MSRVRLRVRLIGVCVCVYICMCLHMFVCLCPCCVSTLHPLLCLDTQLPAHCLSASHLPLRVMPLFSVSACDDV